MTTHDSPDARQIVLATLARSDLSLPAEDTDWLVRAYTALREQLGALRLPEAEMAPLEPAVTYDPRFQ